MLPAYKHARLQTLDVHWSCRCRQRHCSASASAAATATHPYRRYLVGPCPAGARMATPRARRQQTTHEQKRLQNACHPHTSLTSFTHHFRDHVRVPSLNQSLRASFTPCHVRLHNESHTSHQRPTQVVPALCQRRAWYRKLSHTCAMGWVMRGSGRPG